MLSQSKAGITYTALDELSEILLENIQAHKPKDAIEVTRISIERVLNMINMFKEILDDERIEELVKKLNFLNHRSKVSAGAKFMQSFWRNLYEARTNDELTHVILEIERAYENNNHRSLNWLECRIWLESYLTWIKNYTDTHNWGWYLEYDKPSENSVISVMQIIETSLDDRWINSLNRRLRYLARNSISMSLEIWIKILWIKTPHDLEEVLKELEEKINSVKWYNKKD